MSDSNRSESVALVAVACTIVVFLIGLGAGGHYNKAVQQQSAQSNRPNLHLLEGSPENYQAICDSPVDEGHADLCQQWRSANAAAEGANYTKLQFFLGLGGLAGVVATVIYAVRAFRQTVVQAKAATDANRLASETAEMQLRAYIRAECAGILEFSPHRVAGAVRFTNVGNTPAHDVSVLVYPFIVNIPVTSEDQEQIFTFIETHPVHELHMSVSANMSHSAPFDFPPDDQFTLWIPGVHSGETQIAVGGWIRYRDIFGKRRRTNFFHVYGPGAWDAAQGNYHHTGNDSD